jgi:hypothetical protein
MAYRIPALEELRQQKFHAIVFDYGSPARPEGGVVRSE